jgi:hypothetical protein
MSSGLMSMVCMAFPSCVSASLSRHAEAHYYSGQKTRISGTDVATMMISSGSPMRQ